MLTTRSKSGNFVKSDWGKRSLGCTGFSCEFDEIQDKLGIRAVYLRDRFWASRQARLEALFPGIVSHKYDNENSFVFRATGESFEIVLFHGDDEHRMAHALRVHSPILSGKAKVALVSRSTPAGRAKLLRGGFDDVFDIAMSDIEIKVRVLAIVRRIKERLYDDYKFSMVIDWSSIAPYCKSKLTRREAEIFLTLYNNIGKSVDYNMLLWSKILGRRLSGVKSLTVSISKIRRKLNPGVTITALYGNGYMLTLGHRGRDEGRSIRRRDLPVTAMQGL